MKSFLRLFVRNRAAVAGAMILLSCSRCAVRADALSRRSVRHRRPSPIWPSLQGTTLLGTDMIGRDLAAMIVHGARVSLLIGVSRPSPPLLIGVTIGALAGYYGGLVDRAAHALTRALPDDPRVALPADRARAIFEPSVTTSSSASVSCRGTGSRVSRAVSSSLRSASS
jgi:peptide/nickel transport system permease protein